MKLLVHTCCADCLLHLDKNIGIKDKEVGVYFYNPNIHPQSEYLARLLALKKVLADKSYKLIVPHWKPSEYFEVLKLTSEDAKTATSEVLRRKKLRCPKCWYLRLKATFEYAKASDYQAVTTTMLTSNYLDRETISRMGKKLALQYGLEFLVPEKSECELKTRGFYKQNYCGCIFSLNERFFEKYNTVI